MITGKVYKIMWNEEIVYIGSTINTLKSRLSDHFSDSRTGAKVSKWSLFLKEKNYEGFTIEENYQGTFESITMLRAKEREYIDELNPKYNTHCAYLTEEEKKNLKETYRETRSSWKKIPCYCGICKHSVTISSISRHVKTKKHEDNLKSRENDEFIWIG
jgi:hypothetical protein